MEAKPDPYTSIHRALRKVLFEAAIAIGQADTGDRGERERLAERLREISGVLHAHAQHENTFLHPLLSGSNVLETVENSHGHHEGELLEIEAVIDAFEHAAPADAPEAQAQLYRLWNFLIAGQIAHLDYEEYHVLAYLHDNVPLEELGAAHGRMVASFAPEEIRRSLPWICEAESPAAVQAILTRLKAQLPGDVFAGLSAHLFSKSPRARDVASRLGMLETSLV